MQVRHSLTMAAAARAYLFVCVRAWPELQSVLALGATASVDSAGEESEQPPWRGASPAMSLGELASSLESSQDEEEARLRAAVRDPANCVIARGGGRVVPSIESMQRVSMDANPRMQTEVLKWPLRIKLTVAVSAIGNPELFGIVEGAQLQCHGHCLIEILRHT